MTEAAGTPDTSQKGVARVSRQTILRGPNTKFSLHWYADRLEKLYRLAKIKLFMVRVAATTVIALCFAAALNPSYDAHRYLTLTAAVLGTAFILLHWLVSSCAALRPVTPEKKNPTDARTLKVVSTVGEMLLAPRSESRLTATVLLAVALVLIVAIATALLQRPYAYNILHFVALITLSLIAARATVLWALDLRAYATARDELNAKITACADQQEKKREADTKPADDAAAKAMSALLDNVGKTVSELGPRRIDIVHTDHRSGNFARIIRTRLRERRQLLLEAKEVEDKLLSPGAALALLWREGDPKAPSADTPEQDAPNQNKTFELTSNDLLEAVDYRLGVADLFVEKAQYHLEERAQSYKFLGYAMYGAAILIFGIGAAVALGVMFQWDLFKVQPPTTKNEYIGHIESFLHAFTAYGFIVLTAVILTRGARACLDQRERLLSKRHSLRQGRLYLHLTGGRVTIDDLERAFHWNRDQLNAFTHMPTEAKAPAGAALIELIKTIPELVKTGVTAAEKKISLGVDSTGGHSPTGNAS